MGGYSEMVADKIGKLTCRHPKTDWSRNHKHQYHRTSFHRYKLFAAAFTFFLNPTKGRWKPKVLFKGDNNILIIWLKKCSNPEPHNRKLTKLLAMGQIFTKLYIPINTLQESKNITYEFSRGPANITFDTHMHNKLPSNKHALYSLQVPFKIK